MNDHHKPSAIIMFRSGVSDAEKEKVSAFELDLIQKACVGLEPGFKWVLKIVLSVHIILFQA